MISKLDRMRNALTVIAGYHYNSDIPNDPEDKIAGLQNVLHTMRMIAIAALKYEEPNE